MSWTNRQRLATLFATGVLGAVAFSYLLGPMFGLSLPSALEAIRPNYPMVIVWWMQVTYVAAVLMALIPAAVIWAYFDARRRIISGVVASLPILLLLIGDLVYGHLKFDFGWRFGVMLWDGGKIVAAGIGLLIVVDVFRRLTIRWRMTAKPHLS